MVRDMFPLLLCFLTGACAAAPPPPAEYDPGTPIVVQSAEQATAAEAERVRTLVEQERSRVEAETDARQHKEADDRATAVEKHLQREATRSRTTSPGFWNPVRGEKPSDRVVPPPARRCRTVVAAETVGRPYTVRQPDGSYRVGAEPVVVGTQPLEVCDPPVPSRSSR